FSFGAVLYEMETGICAFARKTSADTISAILNEKIPSVSESVKDAPASIDSLIAQCAQKNPSDRFQSAHDISDGLRTLIYGTYVEPAHARPDFRMKPALLIFITAIGLILGASLYFFIEKNQETRSLAILPFVNVLKDPQ